MSFEIILTRSAAPGMDQRLEDTSLPPLTPSDFELIMAGAPLRRRLEDGTCWLWHPDGMAWLSASFRPGKESGGAYIALSVSYAHNQFLKVLADAFDLALRLARHLGARVFEDAGCQEITSENAELMLSPHGKFVTEQAECWQKTVAGIDARMQAPLEYPLGRYDAVNDYFVFFLEPDSQIGLVELVPRLNLSVAPESVAKDRFALMDASSGSLLARVLRRPNDQALQIWPFYWHEQFSRVAPETLNLATLLQKEMGGKLFLREKPLTPEFSRQILENSAGLGVEFFLWLESLPKATGEPS